MQTQTNLKKVYLLLILTTVIWGIQPVCIKMLVTTWPPVTITAMRYFFIGTALVCLAAHRGERFLPSRGCLVSLVLMGLTGIGINNVLQFTGLMSSTVTNCTLIAATSPAITAVCAAIFVRERLPLLAWLGILLSLVGAVAVICRGDLDTLLTLSFNQGDVMFLLAQVAWTTYSLLGIRVMHEMSAAKATGWAGLFGAVLVSSYGLATGEMRPVLLPPDLLLMFLYTVFFGGILAMLWWNIGVKEAGPSVTAIFQNVTPLVGMAGGVLLLGEPLGLLQIGGVLAICGGVCLMTRTRAQ